MIVGVGGWGGKMSFHGEGRAQRVVGPTQEISGKTGLGEVGGIRSVQIQPPSNPVQACNKVLGAITQTI